MYKSVVSSDLLDHVYVKSESRIVDVKDSCSTGVYSQMVDWSSLGSSDIWASSVNCIEPREGTCIMRVVAMVVKGGSSLTLC